MTARAAAHAGIQPAMSPLFDRFTASCARFTGRPAMFLICIIIAGLVVVALLSHDELLITRAHLAISLLTLLLLPVLQAAQNRDGTALQAKLDELIKSNIDARNTMIGVESRSEKEIEQLRTDDETRP